jgi:hypothetical protein
VLTPGRIEDTPEFGLKSSSSLPRLGLGIPSRSKSQKSLFVGQKVTKKSKNPRKVTKKLTFCTPEKAQKVIDF